MIAHLFDLIYFFLCFFNDRAPPEIYTYVHTLSLHDALPISRLQHRGAAHPCRGYRRCRADRPHPARRPGLSHGAVRAVRSHRAGYFPCGDGVGVSRSEEHTSELQSLMRISYAVFCLKKNIRNTTISERSIKAITKQTR